MKKRLLFYEVSKYLSHKNALIITGMRQVGKTTLMRQLFETVPDSGKLWFDLDNPLDQKVFEDIDYRNTYERLLKMAGGGSGRLFVCIDEIQNFPEITKIIKYLMDHYGVKFVVTGSSNYYLKNLFPESLSGRKFLYHLPPLSFPEYLYFREAIALESALGHTLSAALERKAVVEYQPRAEAYEDYLRFGGFPEVVMTPDLATRTQVLKNIFASWFEKDLKILADYADIRELRDLILLLVPRVGSMLEITKLASELAVTRAKIYHYLEFLQGAFFIRLLPRFSGSVDRAVAGGKKIYFTDTGLLNVIGPVNAAQLFENAVINQLAGYGAMSFYHKQNTAEIDAIVDKKIAFEIKLTGTPGDVAKVSRLATKIGLTAAHVISKKYVAIPQAVFPIFL